MALVHVGDAGANRKLVSAVPGIDWAVLGHSGMNLELPEQAGGARMLEAIVKGRNVGRLDLHVVGDSLAFTDRGERAQIETILADHRRQLTEYDKRLGETDPATMRTYYEQRRKEIEAAIARETSLLQSLPATVRGSWFENRIHPAGRRDARPTGRRDASVDAYNRESAERAAAGKPVGIGTEAPRPKPAPGATAAPAGGNYTGTATCGGCHAPALRVLEDDASTRAPCHALERIGRDKDPSCVGCHVTGYLQPGGPTDVTDARARLANVGCEACHGPGSKHGAALDKRGTLAPAVPEATCRGCHTPDVTGGDFDYEKFVQAIVGPGRTLAPGPARPL